MVCVATRECASFRYIYKGKGSTDDGSERYHSQPRECEVSWSTSYTSH
jgi:hypothetical protein